MLCIKNYCAIMLGEKIKLAIILKFLFVIVHEIQPYFYGLRG